MFSYFQCLYPVVWKQSLKKLNDSIDQKNNTLLAHQRKCPFVSEYEYWSFIGLLLLASVQKTGGMDGVFKAKKEEGIVTRVPVDKYMSYTRFNKIKEHWIDQFADEDVRETDQWWKVRRLVEGFNKNRSQVVASSRVKVLDETMSAYRPQTSKTGNIPHLSFIARKPEPLGTELKMLHQELQTVLLLTAKFKKVSCP